jgi:ABC-type dipeptide/oligopeptide/nickel transport system permease component
VILRRLLPLPLLLLAASVLAFALPRLVSGDADGTVRAVLRARVASETPDPQVQAAVAAEFGLDGPVVGQYLRWMGAVLRGDFGLGYVTRAPVADQLGSALGVSGLLGGCALLLAALIGIPAGVYAARRPGGPLDRTLSAATVAGVSVPEFVLAPWLVLVAAVGLGVLPALGWGGPQHVVLPALTLAAYPAALAAQLVRAETIDVLGRDHVRFARAKGLSERRVLWRHAARLGCTSVTSLSGMFVAGFLGGSVVVEVVFGIPGAGRLMYDAVLARDLPVVQAGTLVIVAVAVVAGIVVELVQLATDPVARDREAAR